MPEYVGHNTGENLSINLAMLSISQSEQTFNFIHLHKEKKHNVV